MSEASTSKRGGKRSTRGSKSDKQSVLEPNTWECTLCTYRNKSEAFKCDVCETRKGTSTRKPRLTSTVVEHQQLVEKIVVQQQQTLLGEEKRTYRRSRNGTESPSCASMASDSMSPSLDAIATPISPQSSHSEPNATTSDTRDHIIQRECHSLMETPCKDMSIDSELPQLTASEPQTSTSKDDVECGVDDKTPDLTPQKILSQQPQTSLSSPPPNLNKHLSSVQKRPVSHHRKISGTLKGVDRNSARTLAVTVNGITVVVTDYKLKTPKKRKISNTNIANIAPILEATNNNLETMPESDIKHENGDQTSLSPDNPPIKPEMKEETSLSLTES